MVSGTPITSKKGWLRRAPLNNSALSSQANVPPASAYTAISSKPRACSRQCTKSGQATEVILPSSAERNTRPQQQREKGPRLHRLHPSAGRSARAAAMVGLEPRDLQREDLLRERRSTVEAPPRARSRLLAQAAFPSLRPPGSGHCCHGYARAYTVARSRHASGGNNRAPRFRFLVHPGLRRMRHGL